MTQELDLESGIADIASMAEVCNQIADKYWGVCRAGFYAELNPGGFLLRGFRASGAKVSYEETENRGKTSAENLRVGYVVAVSRLAGSLRRAFRRRPARDHQKATPTLALRSAS